MNESMAGDVVQSIAQSHEKEIVQHQHLVETVYVRYWSEICDYLARRFGTGPPEPEDVAQSAFANFASLEDPALVENPRAFLYRAAHNIAVSHYRHTTVHEKYVRQAFAIDDNALVERRCPERSVIGDEGLEILVRTLWELPKKQRRFLLMNRFDGMSYADISRKTGLSQSAVRKHVAKAVAVCQKALRDAGM